MAEMTEPPEIDIGSAKRQGATVRTGDAADAKFWDAPVGDDPCQPTPVHGKVIEWSGRLRTAWKKLTRADREHDAIYESRRLTRRGGAVRAAGLRQLDLAGFDSTRLFVTTSIVDTFVARMAKRKAMPMFVVDDAEWSLKQRAQDCRRWLHGKLREASFDKLYPAIIRDASVRGDGVVYVDETDDDILIERVHRRELLVDPYEARQGAGAVRTMYRVRAVSRDSLIARFPHHAAAIRNAPPSIEPEVSTADWLASEGALGTRDTVDFVEAWHLSDDDCDDADDACTGRRAACIEGATLCYENWTTPRFPFARLTRYAPQDGFWGRGDVELLRSLQAMINQMVDDIGMNVSVTGKGVWITPPGIQPGQLVGYRPFHLEMPAGAQGRTEFYHPPPVSPATLDLLERFIGKAHELTGAAQWFSQGRSPLGAGASGVALDTQEDLLSDRHSVFEGGCSQFVVDVAQCLIDAARRCALRMKAAESGEDGEAYDEETDDGMEDGKTPPRKRKRTLPSAWLDKTGMHRFDWDSVAMEEEQYRLQIEPTSSIPSTRAGKLAWISEMIGKGVMPSSSAALLYDEPDVAHANRVQLAALKNVERMVELAGDPTKELPTPEEWHDLDALLVYCKAYYNRAQAENAPEEVQSRYRDLGDAALLIRDRGKQEPAVNPTAPPQPPGPPMGAPPGLDPMAAGMPPGM